MTQFESSVLSPDTALDNIDGEATFVASGDYHLVEGSPGIGQGISPDLSVDYAGTDIAQGDIGTGYNTGLYSQSVYKTGMVEIKQAFSQIILDNFRAKALSKY